MTQKLLDSRKTFWNSLGQLLKHYYRDEKEHFRRCSPALKKNHIFRELQTLKKTLASQLRNSNPLTWLSAGQRSAIDIDVLLEERKMVAVVWCIEDVQDVRPDLTEEQAWEVLRCCRQRHDCNFGFNWEFIEMVADDRYPDTAE